MWEVAWQGELVEALGRAIWDLKNLSNCGAVQCVFPFWIWRAVPVRDIGDYHATDWGQIDDKTRRLGWRVDAGVKLFSLDNNPYCLKDK